eukprot:3893972-Rhodomonas_salina.1
MSGTNYGSLPGSAHTGAVPTLLHLRNVSETRRFGMMEGLGGLRGGGLRGGDWGSGIFGFRSQC